MGWMLSALTLLSFVDDESVQSCASASESVLRRQEGLLLLLLVDGLATELSSDSFELFEPLLVNGESSRSPSSFSVSIEFNDCDDCDDCAIKQRMPTVGETEK